MTKARIIEIKAAGAVVLLENNEKAWLPGQEISTKYIHSKKLVDQSLCSVNQELDVIVYERELGGKQKLVSHIRFDNDPWNKIKNWKEGEIKEMGVGLVTASRVYGNIEPGIRGFVELADIYDKIPFPRSWKGFQTISVGDMIAGLVKINNIDSANRLVKLSPAEYILNQQNIPEFLPITKKALDVHSRGKDFNSQERHDRPVGFPTGVQHILALDDDQKFLDEICSYLKNCGIETTGSVSKNEIMKLLENPGCPDFDIAILDVNLADRYDYIGFQVAKALIRQQPRCHIIMTTGEYFETEKIFKIAGNMLISSFLFKPFGIEELTNAVDAAMAGSDKKLENFLSTGDKESEPGSSILDKTGSLQTVVSDLKKEIDAEIVVLFSIHPLSFAVRITAYSGVLRIKAEEYLAKMRFSPVKDAAVDKENIFESKIKNTPKFSKHRWLVNALGYESCIGIPVNVHHEWAYCLFAFHGNENFFDDIDLYKVKTTAEKIALHLEMQRLEQTIKSENPFFLAGKTYGSMAHDLVNTLNREFGIQHIFNLLKGKENLAADEIADVKKNLDSLRDDLKRAKGIVETFRRMSRSHHEQEKEVDVYDMVKKAVDIIKIEAKALNTEIVVQQPPGGIRGKVKIRETALEQVLYNLFLNSAQQIARFAFARGKGYILVEFAVIEPGEKETKPDEKTAPHDNRENLNKNKDKTWLQVLIHDSGPGIHACDFEKIFEKGYTTKEDGCGMGLDICRNIISQAGGAISVLKSILFCGASFEIRLPLNFKEN